MTGAERRLPGILSALRSWCIFFVCNSAMLSICMVVFLSVFARTNQVVIDSQTTRPAAVATLLMAVLVSLLATVLDIWRRKESIEKPVRRIAAAAEQVIAGDLTVRIEQPDSLVESDALRRVTDCFNRMTAELSETETLRTDFIANVSHELKTPLAVIQNYGTLLAAPDLPEADRIAYAQTVADSAAGLANMVANILKLNKLEHQNIYPDTRRYDLGEQLCECLLAFEHVWEEKGIEIETELEEGVKINADPELLSLVWNNLFSNAFKFTGPGGTVALRLKREQGRAVVSVQDTGCGISPEVGNRIFEKFYQGDPSHADKGNGLGLALVRRVIDITGGDIAVTSVVGQGSTFTVTLACAEVPHEA